MPHIGQQDNTQHSQSGIFWHEYNDLGPTREIVNVKKTIQPHIIMYTLTDKIKKFNVNILDSDCQTIGIKIRHILFNAYCV